jgi:HK97 family phage major capsid protein
MKMTLKLLKAWKAFQAGSVIEVDEPTANSLKAAEVACDWTAADTARVEEQKALVQSAVAEAVKGLKPTSIATNAPAAGATDYKNFGAFLKAVRGQHVDYKVCQGTGNNERVDDEGGYLVDEQFSRTLLQRMNQNGVLTAGMDRVPIGPGYNGLKFNELQDYDRRDGHHAVNVYRILEACEKTKSSPKFSRRSVDLEKLVGLYYATDELLQDEPALEAMVATWFGREFSYKMDYEAMHGAGTTELLGLLNSAALVTIKRNNPGVVDANDVARMYSRMYAPSIRSAEWFVSSSVLPQLIGMTIGDQPVWLPPGGLAVAPYGTLFGRPIRICEVSPLLGATGDIGFFDMSEYLLVEKGGVQAASSIHVRFVFDETAFRFVLRNNGLPKWSRSIYPNQGTDEISPFIVLEGAQGGTPTPTI